MYHCFKLHLCTCNWKFHDSLTQFKCQDLNLLICGRGRGLGLPALSPQLLDEHLLRTVVESVVLWQW